MQAAPLGMIDRPRFPHTGAPSHSLAGDTFHVERLRGRGCGGRVRRMSGSLDRPMYEADHPRLGRVLVEFTHGRLACPPWCETVRPPGPGVALWRWVRRALGMRVSPRLCRACWQEATDWLFRRARDGR